MSTMKRPASLLLFLCCTFLAFGYTTRGGNGISKIYLNGDLLVRTQPGVDIRFYDVANPGAVREIGTLGIEGNSDVAVKGDYLYADRGRDLVVFNISDPGAVREVSELKTAFRVSGAELASAQNALGNDGDSFGGASGCGEGCDAATSNDNDQWQIDNGWLGTTPPINYNSATGGTGGGGTNVSSGSNSGGSNAVPREGTGGSLARFLVVANRLYTIDDRTLTSYDISDPSAPKKISSSDVNGTIETIFFAKYHLFIGGERGVYIYDVEDGSTPEYRGEFEHAERCDPVVVDGDYAYVTLRGGSQCGGWSNQLDILDVSDVSNPRLINSYTELISPYGLAARNGTAFVCDGPAGLRVLDVSDPYRVRECRHYNDIKALDVIWQNNLLIVNTGDGFYLYDAADPCNLKEYGLLF